ncbi:MAG TPA: UbiX family flavin prenyltransferase [Bacteroidales bacterium]|nr:UbiX family flavin prenyltransferase [Bacteroidales bacterium]
MAEKIKLIVGVTGASGAIYAKVLFEELVRLNEQVANCSVVFSENGKKVWEYELGNDDYRKIPFRIYENNDFYAPMASGSAAYHAMIVCPCTMGTLGRIASGVSNDLLTRAADVMLKERRKLILVTREMPLNLIHINNMKTVTEAGGIICPASPAFYHKPATLEEAVKTVIDRTLLLAGFQTDSKGWGV